MLKIKDNVDLKELEKFGFEWDDDFGFSKKIDTSDESWSDYTIINIIGEKGNYKIQAFWEDFDYLRYYDNFPYKYIQDLVEADLVEKVSND